MSGSKSGRIASLIVRIAARQQQIAPGIEVVEGIFPADFLAVQTTREGGASAPPYASFNLASHVGDDPLAVSQNRQRLEKCCATIPAWLEQVHGVKVANLDAREPLGKGRIAQADAAISTRAGWSCAVLTADCLPILVARERSPGCAAIHAGWRGLHGGVIEETLSAMLACNPVPDRWSFWLGPCIGPQAYEVGDDVRQAFLQEDSLAVSAFRPRAGVGGKYLADLRLLAEQRIVRWFADRPQAVLTIESENGTKRQANDRPIRIARSSECTVLDRGRYFSFRRDRETGRMASLIAYRSI